MSKEIGGIGGIYISPAPANLEKPARGGFDTVKLKAGVLFAGNGICSTDGLVDRYCGPDGEKSRGAYPPDKVRQLSIITLDAIERANNVSDIPFTWAETRRNIIVYGMKAEELNEFGLAVLKFGDAEIEITGLCEPCDRPSSLSNKKDLRRHLQTVKEQVWAELEQGF